MQHKNILRLIKHFEDDRNYYLLLEYCELEFLEFILQNKYLPEFEIIEYFF